MNGSKSAQTTKDRYGEDYFRKIGRKGGSVKPKKPRGFAYLKEHDPERLVELGRKGGATSRRGI